MSGKDKKGGAQGEQKSTGKDAKDSKVGAASGHTVQTAKTAKRTIDEVANSSAEEMLS